MSFLDSLFWSLLGASRSRRENPQRGGKRTEGPMEMHVYKTGAVQDAVNILF